MMILKQKQSISKDRISDELKEIMWDRILQISFSGSTSISFVGVIDIVDSTRIAATIGEVKLSLYYTVFLNSMASIVRKYGGRVVKNIGDSLLYYFPEQDMRGCNSCLDCSIAMLESRETINEILDKYGLPPLHYRISADYGKIHHAKSLGVITEDIFGMPVNIATKINSLAKRDDFVIGGDCYQIAKSTGHKFKEIVGLKIGLGREYSVYHLSK